MIKRNYVRETIFTNKANYVAFERLKKEKTIVEVELRIFKVVYSSLN